MVKPMIEQSEILRIQGIRKAFNTHRVLVGIDLSLRTCETVSVLGGSGSGKTTLLRLIAGLIKPDRGQIFLFGQDIVPMSERDLLPLRRRIGVVFQGAALFDSLTVFENIAFPLRLHTRTSEQEIRARVAELLKQVELPGIEEQYPAELSGGMKKRVGIARALALQPEVVLFDEPTAGLDPTNGRMICQLIAELRRDLCETSVVVTHDLQCAFAISDQIAFVHQGEIIEVASPEEFLHSSRPEAQMFVKGVFDQATTLR
jgi:phospholipid/cholesterol/gamma-HCH transport system ATP-binding protein